jgi:hypothetical protein
VLGCTAAAACSGGARSAGGWSRSAAERHEPAARPARPCDGTRGARAGAQQLAVAPGPVAGLGPGWCRDRPPSHPHHPATRTARRTCGRRRSAGPSRCTSTAPGWSGATTRRRWCWQRTGPRPAACRWPWAGQGRWRRATRRRCCCPPTGATWRSAPTTRPATSSRSSTSVTVPCARCPCRPGRRSARWPGHPDGRRLAVTVGEVLLVVDLRYGTARRLPQGTPALGAAFSPVTDELAVLSARRTSTAGIGTSTSPQPAGARCRRDPRADPGPQRRRTPPRAERVVPRRTTPRPRRPRRPRRLRARGRQQRAPPTLDVPHPGEGYHGSFAGWSSAERLVLATGPGTGGAGGDAALVETGLAGQDERVLTTISTNDGNEAVWRVQLASALLPGHFARPQTGSDTGPWSLRFTAVLSVAAALASWVLVQLLDDLLAAARRRRRRPTSCSVGPALPLPRSSPRCCSLPPPPGRPAGTAAGLRHLFHRSARGSPGRRRGRTRPGPATCDSARVTPAFVPASELSAAFYRHAVAPVLAGQPHAAALLGWGSDVLGFDTERSTDHGWGPRVLILLPAGDADRADTWALKLDSTCPRPSQDGRSGSGGTPRLCSTGRP